jgi:hypothetical protein
LELLAPGHYQTACRKGHWPCGEKAPAFLELTRPALRLLTYEKASEIYYWDSEKQGFQSVAESD